MPQSKFGTWDRFGGTKENRDTLIGALAALVRREGQITIPLSELESMENRIGLRARFEPDGGITLWTYDVVDDMKGIADEHRH